MIQLLAAFGFPASARGGFEVIGEPTALGQQVGVVLRQPVVADEARHARFRQLRQRRGDRAPSRLVHHQRRQVGLGEVAIVVRFFLAAHRVGAALGGIEQARFLHDAAAVLDDIDLTLDLVLEGFLQVAERVDVLHFRLGAERRFPDAANRHVRVAAQAPLLHVAVVHAQPDDNLPELLEERRRFLGGAHVRLAHNLDERHAGAVVVEIRPPIGIGKALVERLAGILFHVDAREADVLGGRGAAEARRFGSPVGANLEAAAERERLLVLGNLIALRQIGIEVVLAREHGALVHLRPERERGPHRVVDRGAIEHRQRARVPETHRADVRVRRRAEGGRTAAEDLGRRQQLRMNLETDDRLIRRHG